MKRPLRIALEIIGPPLFGLLPFYVMMTPDLIANIAYGHVNPAEHFAIFGGAYMVAGIPSIIYAVVMETAFSRFFSPKSWRAVMLSTILGLFSGVLISGVAGALRIGHDTGHSVFVTLIPTMVPLGIFVGFLMGLLVKVLSETEPNQAPEPTPTTVTPPAGQEARQP